jgi:putative FmdB family regulatory protein
MVPFYDYSCGRCGSEFETFHHMIESPLVKCPRCGGSAKKIVSACGIIVRNTGARRAASDRAKTESEARSDLLENYGVEKIQPVGSQSIMSVYNDVKAQGKLVRDQMQKKREENAKRVRDKHRDWAIKANRRVATRALAANERKSKEAAAKRAINV